MHITSWAELGQPQHLLSWVALCQNFRWLGGKQWAEQPVDPKFQAKTRIRAKWAKWPKKGPNFGILAPFLKNDIFFFNNNKAISKIIFKDNLYLHCSVSYKYTNMIGALASLFDFCHSSSLSIHFVGLTKQLDFISLVF